MDTSHDSPEDKDTGRAVTTSTRREFIQLMSASMAAVGIAGCGRRPPEAIVPYLRMPEGMVPGNPRWYATTLSLAGIGRGVLAETHEGRPTKIEGNPRHPGSLGATDIFAQAAVLDLYDGARSRAPGGPDGIASFAAVASALEPQRARWNESGGDGLAILTEPDSSPVLHSVLSELRQRWPGLRWYQHDTLPADNWRRATREMLGRPMQAVARLDRARVVVSFDCDVLGPGPAQTAMARQFAATRNPAAGSDGFSRYYALESTPGLTGAVADHSLALAANDIEAAIEQVASALGILPHPNDGPLPQEWLHGITRDLRRAGAGALLLVGDHCSPRAHGIGLLINDALHATDNTVGYIDPVIAAPDTGLAELAGAIDAGDVTSLVMLCHDPISTAPGDISLAGLLARLELCVHHALYPGEAAAAGSGRWHVPRLHELESWGDSKAFDGTVSLVQPAITPLFSGFTCAEFLRWVAGDLAPNARDITRGFWRAQHGNDFDDWWHEALASGVVSGTAATPQAVRPDASRLPAATPLRPVDLCLRLTPDESLWDGRFARNPWLQELPRPHSKIVWGHCALLAPDTAARLGVNDGQRVRIETDAGAAEVSAFVLPGHALNQVSLSLSTGPAKTSIGSGEAFEPDVANSYRLRGAGDRLVVAASLTPLPGKKPAVTGQRYFSMDGDRHARGTTLEEFLANPDLFHDEPAEQPPDVSLYPPPAQGDYAWGMTVDLNTCIGCNACTIACQAENNIPTVGPDEARRGRTMHWIRIDRYSRAAETDSRSYFQPVPCMHCEYAPCELVCPTEATVHDDEGLNLMVYNRCIGTRDCSQNCPYKVRRFNWLDYNPYGDDPPLSVAQFNPDVTVRSRGVMEKCTYCIQRISRARRDAKAGNRRIASDEVVTACQAVCPTQAITFGDLKDANSRVAELKRDRRNYDLLGELNTRPRTSYLAKLSNPGKR